MSVAPPGGNEIVKYLSFIALPGDALCICVCSWKVVQVSPWTLHFHRNFNARLCFALKRFRDKKENERNFVSLNWIQIVLLDSIVCVINSLPFPLPPQQSQVDKQFNITGVSFKK